MKSIIKSVLDGDWVELKRHYEQVAAKKVMDRINEKKTKILAKINGVDVEAQDDAINSSK